MQDSYEAPVEIGADRPFLNLSSLYARTFDSSDPCFVA